ncbi:DUF3945 domain-containing protein [Spirosoma sp. 209]|uniref:DUF3945 domain-containing protein n=1 Tax=Spirosoma sp. 209 TaxID=1955701 RepID=UPI00098CF7F3|nr:DUF3945 domain-containing protein [Spirosoma sp. 209]
MDSPKPDETVLDTKNVQSQPTEATPQQVFEQIETQQYQLILPAEYEELRSFLENDGLLSDEEITKCLYDESLRQKDLAKLIEEKTPSASEGEQKKLTAYLWDLHETVKGQPLVFVDPKQIYRIDVVDAPDSRSAETHQSAEKLSSSASPDRPTVSSEISPVTLHLDINGGFLANFLHNARLNHEQMNRFIADLERQHDQLKAQVHQGQPQQLTPDTRPAENVASEKPYQLLQESGPSPTRWQRVRQTVSNWITPSTSNKPQITGQTQTNPQPYDIARSGKEPPDKQPDKLVQANPGQSVNEPTVSYAPQPIVNQQTNRTAEAAVPMKETITPGVESPVASRPTRYQWADVADQFEKIGITRPDLEKAGQLDDLLNGRKTGLMRLTQTGEEGKPFQISGKLYIVNTPDKGPIIGIQPERKQLLLPKEFLGYELSARDKQNLEKNGEMGKRVELTDKMTGQKFGGYVGVDKETRSLTVLRAERLHIPQTIKGVTLNKQQQKSLEQGRAIKLEGMTSNNGQSFNAYVQVSAAKRSLTFAKIPDNVVKQTVDQKTAQDLTKPVHQLKGDGAGGKKTIQPKDEIKQATAQRVEAPQPVKQQKMAAAKPVLEETKAKKPKKQKGQRL